MAAPMSDLVLRWPVSTEGFEIGGRNWTRRWISQSPLCTYGGTSMTTRQAGSTSIGSTSLASIPRARDASGTSTSRARGTWTRSIRAGAPSSPRIARSTLSAGPSSRDILAARLRRDAREAWTRRWAATTASTHAPITIATSAGAGQSAPSCLHSHVNRTAWAVTGSAMRTALDW
jgi:urease accessory protein UreF